MSTEVGADSTQSRLEAQQELFLPPLLLEQIQGFVLPLRSLKFALGIYRKGIVPSFIIFKYVERADSRIVSIVSPVTTHCPTLEQPRGRWNGPRGLGINRPNI